MLKTKICYTKDNGYIIKKKQEHIDGGSSSFLPL